MEMAEERVSQCEIDQKKVSKLNNREKKKSLKKKKKD